MLETSKDILYLILAFSILWVSIWFSWILYQMGRTIKQANDIIGTTKKIIDNVHEGTEVFKDKAKNVSAVATVLIKSGEQLLKTFVSKKKNSDSKTKKSKK